MQAVSENARRGAAVAPPVDVDADLGQGPAPATDVLHAIVECARSLFHADAARLSLDDGRKILARADSVPAFAKAASGLRAGTDIRASDRDACLFGDNASSETSVPGGTFRVVEPVIGPDGRSFGALSVFDRQRSRSVEPTEATMLKGLARIAAALLDEQAALAADLGRFREVFTKSPSLSWIYDRASLRFLDVNDAAIRFYGFSREQFLSMTVLDIRPAAERRRMTDAVETGSDLDAVATWRHCLADGREVDVITQGRRIGFGGVDAVVAVAIDRTEVRALRQDLSDTQFTLDSIVAALPIGLFIKDMEDQGRYLVYNPSAAEVIGRTPDALVGRIDHDLFGPDQAAHFLSQDLAVMSDGRQQTFESEDIAETDGRVRQVRTIKKPLPKSDGGAPRYLLGLSEDITERRQSEQRITHMALHDALTDLPNRVLFKQHVEKALKQRGKHKTFALFYLDLDYFKTINDSYGHHIGDLLLKSVAARLRSRLRRGDTVARLGGDEFAILARVPMGEADAVLMSEQISKSFDLPFELGECVAHIDTSIGIALSGAAQSSSEALMRHADIALYAAKSEGRGVAKVYVDRMSRHVESRQSISEDLRHAVARQEFELDYQPLYDLESDRITGFEALVRWRHPVRGLISPGDFIPVAEQTGLIVPIGEWVLRTACRTAAAWPTSVKVAVNLSAVQFRKEGLVDMIERTLADIGLDPAKLELEITESVLLSDSGANLQILHRLRALGVRIAMDDFGTGYSSLSYLRAFPFDKIKMDRSFVADVCVNHESLAIVRAVTGLGASLSITTTAEGIETREQFDRLKAEGFDELQGYLIGRPMPADRATALAFSQPSMKGAASAA